MDLLLVFIGAGAIGASTSLILIRTAYKNVFEAICISVLLTLGVVLLSAAFDIQHHEDAPVTNQIKESENG